MPLNALTIFAAIFLGMGVIADLISLWCEGKRFYKGEGASGIPMVGFVFYAICCFVWWIYLPWQTVAWAMGGLTVFHLVCQFAFFFLGKGKERDKEQGTREKAEG
jgi:hypothetical protein